MFSLLRMARGAALVLVALAFPVAAHEGHDHGAEKPAISPANTVPMLELMGDEVQLVASLHDGALILFIDRLADNMPVINAAITLSVGDAAPVAARPQADGTYLLPAPWAVAGDHPVTVSVAGAGVTDLLVGALSVPVAEEGDEHGFLDDLGSLLPLATLTFLAGLGIGALAHQRWRGSAVLPLVLLTALALPGTPARAHEGHDHGTMVVPFTGKDQPRRLPDGSLYVPKQTQRLLAVRTLTVQVGEVTPVRTLTGRVIPDPNRSGRVQAAQSGRILPPEGGFPRPGAMVAAGQVLALIELTLRAEDGGGISEQLASLDKDIRLARQQWERVSRLPGTIPQREIDDARTSLDGLLKQRAALGQATRGLVPLHAPIAGQVVASHAIAGQMIEDRDVSVLFEITDPTAKLVEVLSFDGPLSVNAAVSADIAGRSWPVQLAGQGPVGAAGATRLLFALEEGEGTPAIGSIARVLIPAAAPISGLLLPSGAITRGPDGLPMVLVQATPQHFLPQPVRIAPAGDGQVQVLDGVGAGDRVVVQGASLLSQIR